MLEVLVFIFLVGRFLDKVKRYYFDIIYGLLKEIKLFFVLDDLFFDEVVELRDDFRVLGFY